MDANGLVKPWQSLKQKEKGVADLGIQELEAIAAVNKIALNLQLMKNLLGKTSEPDDTNEG